MSRVNVAEVRGRVLSWAGEEGLAVREDANPAGLDLAIEIPAEALRIEVRAGPSGDRVTLEHRVAVPAEEAGWGRDLQVGVPTFAALVERLVEGRPGLVSGEVRSGDQGDEVSLRATVFLDGFSRQAFLAAIDELVKASKALDRLREEMRTGRELLGRTQASASEPVSAPTPAATPASAPAATSIPARPSASAQATLPGPAQPPAWSAGYVAPAGGLPAWSAPDPGIPPAATLAEGLPLALAERRGDWARVVAENGWTGWVDARRLVSRGS